MNRFGSVRFWQWFLCAVALFDLRLASAQVEAGDIPADEPQSSVDLSKPLSWQDACKLIGNQDPAVAKEIEATLRDALRSPERSEVMACALILLFVDQGNCDAVKTALSATRTAFPKPSAETQCFIARVRLWLWLTLQEPKCAEYATSTFRELVTNTQRESLSKADLRAHAQAIGTVCSMLKSDLAESPIAANYLQIAEQCLLGSKSSEVKSRFKQSHKAAEERTEALGQVIEHVKTSSPNALADEQSARKAKLADLGYEFTNTRELMIEIVRNSREISRQNTLDRRKLADYITRLQREWMIPTAGHPGPAPIEPREPVKSEVKVREYETETEYETRIDSNGNKYEVKKTKEVKRDSSVIERERNEKYVRLVAEYRVLKADFDQRIVIYVPLLKSWLETDRIRRVKLQEERAAAAARREELLATNNQLREEASDAKSEFQEQRSEVEILAEKYELTDIAMQTLESTSSAFRPPHFELVDVEQEKFRLLGRTKK